MSSGTTQLSDGRLVRYGRISADFALSDTLCWLIQTRGEREKRGSLSVVFSVGINLLFDSGLDHKLTPRSKVKLLLLPLLSPSVVSEDFLPTSSPVVFFFSFSSSFLLFFSPIPLTLNFYFPLFFLLSSCPHLFSLALINLFSFYLLISVPPPPRFLLFFSQFWFLLTNEIAINLF